MVYPNTGEAEFPNLMTDDAWRRRGGTRGSLARNAVTDALRKYNSKLTEYRGQHDGGPRNVLVAQTDYSLLDAGLDNRQ